jgi:predicted dehydrogenase
MQKKKVRAAIVGAGAIATGIGTKKYAMTHIESYRSLSDRVEFVGFAEISKEQRQLVKDRFPYYKYYESLHALLDSEHIDIISICTPDHCHEELVLEALDANISGLWCEKPLSITLKGTREIFQKSRSGGTPIQVNYFRRFIPEIIDIKEKIESKTYGDIKLINGFYSDTYIHNGAHLIDLIQFFAGAVKLKNVSTLGDVNDDGSVVIFGTINGDCLCTIQPFSRKYYNIFELDIFCESARVRICENGRRIVIYLVKNDTEFLPLKILNPEPRTILCNWKSAFTNALSNLLDVVDGKENETLSKPEYSMTTIEFIESIRRIISC